jgi:hypothetical protein
LRFVTTRYREFANLSRSVEVKLALQPIPGLKIDGAQVNLILPVEQNTEVTFDVPIQVLNKPSDVTLKTFPGSVRVSCRIGLSKYKDLNSNTFSAFISYDKISTKEALLPVSFENHANFVLSVDYAPKEVEYILEREK